MRSIDLQSQSWDVSDEAENTGDTNYSHLYARP